MGVVYRAAHKDNGAQVAIKTVRLPNQSLLSMLRREIRALTRIHHPGVIRIVDDGVESGLPWYAMELFQGRTFADLLDRWTPEPGDASIDAEAETGASGASANSASRAGAAPSAGRRPANPWLFEGLTVVRRLCSTLSYLHGEGIVHRDLKPSNILIRSDGTSVLTDFGLVSTLWSDGGRQMLDVSTGGIGTPGYMAPEQILGSWGDARADLYALGCMLYELASGHTPFQGESQEHILDQHLNAPVVPPSALVDGVSPLLDDLIVRLLAKDPRDRLAYSDDVSRELERLGVAGQDAEGLPSRPYLYRPAMVGRADIGARIVTLLRSATLGQGAMAFVGGESGVGKTTLATAVCQAAQRLDMDVVTSVCLPSSSRGATGEIHGAPLHAFVPLLQAVADIAITEGRESAAHLLGPHGSVLGAYEPSILDAARTAGLGDAVSLPAEAMQQIVLATLTDVLSRFAERRPLLLVIDDLQWADDLSLKVLAALQIERLTGQKLVILGTYRSEAVTAELRALADRDGVGRWQLGPLDGDSVQSLVSDMLAMKDVPAPLTRAIARSSAGNPLFVSEYLRSAVDDRTLRRDRGQWTLAVAPSAGASDDEYARLLNLPRSVQDVIARRIDRLGAAARAQLDVAAVAGKRTDLDLLLEVAGEANEDERLLGLGDLIIHNLLEQTGGGLAFVHDRAREVTYARMDADRRRMLHRAVAVAIEARTDTPDAQRLGELAEHWNAAGDPAKARDYLERAGDHALRTSAYRDALGHLSNLIAMQESAPESVDPKRLAKWHRLLAETHKCVDEFDSSRTHLEAALRLMQWPVPRSRAGLAGATFLELGRQIQRRVRSGWTGRSDASSPEFDAASRAYFTLLEVSRFMGDKLLPGYATLRALNIAELGATPAQRGKIVRLFQILLCSAGVPSIAARYDQLAGRELVLTLDPVARAETLLFEAIYHLYAGHPAACVSSAEEGRRLAESVGLKRRWQEATMTLACVPLFGVEPVTGLPIFEELRDGSRGVHRVQSWALVGLAVLRARLGQLDRARDEAAEATRLVERLDVVDAVLPHAGSALVLHLRGEPDRALEHADKAMALLARTPAYVVEQHAVMAWLVEVYVSTWMQAAPNEPARARAAERACRQTLAVAAKFRWVEPPARYWMGRFEGHRGRSAAARQQFERSLASAEAMQMPFHQGRAHLALAALDANAASSQRHRELAGTLFAQAGVPPPTSAA
jgi:tetratricopeptide (TPR) repeat protein